MQISPMVCCGDFALISVGCEKPPGVCPLISCRGAQTFPPWCLPTFIVRVAGSCKVAIFISVLFLYVGVLLLLVWMQTGSRQHLLKQACLFFFSFLFS